MTLDQTQEAVQTSVQAVVQQQQQQQQQGTVQQQQQGSVQQQPTGQPQIIGQQQVDERVLMTPSSLLSSTFTINSLNALTNQIPIPDGWEQKLTPEGEVYFVNHIDRTTTWFDPRIPSHLHKHITLTANQIQAGKPPSMTGASQLPIGTNVQQVSNPAHNSAQSALRRVQQLSEERERLRQRAQEIQRTQLLQQKQQQQNASAVTAAAVASAAAAASTTAGDTMTNTNCITTRLDPFLGSNNLTNSDCHSRQESADSGLGLGPNYSLPHTPEGILNSELDERILNLQNTADDLGLDSLAITNMDLGPDPMDSDDLMSSLPDEFNSDIVLSDIEALLTANANNKDPIWI